MTKEGPTKTQAQKNAEREERLKQQEEERRAAWEARAAIARQEALAKKAEEEAAAAAKSKAELRKAKREAKKSFQIPFAESDKEKSKRILGVSSVESADPVPASHYRDPASPRNTDTSRSTSRLSNRKNTKNCSDDEDADDLATPNDIKTSLTSSTITDAIKDQKDARIVHNHSTHCEGLRPVLVRLMKTPGIKTITPGRLHQVSSRVPHFELKIQRRDVDNPGSIKLVARNGQTAQDVFVVLSPAMAKLEDMEWLQDAVRNAVENSTAAKALREEEDGDDYLSSIAGLGAISLQNKSMGAEMVKQWKAQQQTEYLAKKAAEKERKAAEASKAELAKLRRISRKDKAKVPGLKNTAME